METSPDVSFGDITLSTSFCQTTIELQNALKSSVNNILNNVSDDVFIDIYKTCYKGFQKKDDIQRPSLSGSSIEARKFRQQFNNLVMEGMTEAITETLATTMDSKLKELEELKREQTETSLIWRPPGNALKHMMPFDAVLKTEEKQQIQNHVEKEMEAINLLKARLVQKRLKAKELHEILQSSLNNIEKAVVSQIDKPDEKTPET